LNPEIADILTKYYKDEMVSIFSDRPELLNELLELALGNEARYSWRAAWLLNSCIQPHDERIQKCISKIMHVLPGKKDGHQRELLNMLMKLKIDEDTEGELFDLCISLWEQIHKSPSVRYTAFRIILSIIQKYPEMAQEISFLMQPQYLETLSPGIKRAVLMRYEEVTGAEKNS